MQYAQELATWRFEIVLAPLPSPSFIVLIFFKLVQQKVDDEAHVISPSVLSWFAECELKGCNGIFRSDPDKYPELIKMQIGF